ncbi:hypothetical protein [Rubinisphaera italica]|uniref:Xylose isomerase-like TIM barrel n=1 Tax=Rubinisphaera italica TaxID=2527969 RepID=A0A5C5XGB9_9PLAN|nr:hypothetical protein [Rubinisphaera italica]TWT61719.1 hypothetical protein Pan54_24560 [Rubinisphaera italica]
MSHSNVKLIPGIITSCFARGIFTNDSERQQKIKRWLNQLNEVYHQECFGENNPSRPMPVELYVLMQKDGAFLRSEITARELPEGDISVIELLGYCKYSSVCEQFAEFIWQQCQLYNIMPIGFATFIPGICRNHSEEDDKNRILKRTLTDRRFESISALVGLRKLAQSLNKKMSNSHYGEGIRNIEIVCGSRVEGLIQSSDKNKETDSECVMIVENEEGSIPCLLNALREAIEQTNDVTTPFSLEMEPGELFLANSLNTLRECVEQISKDNLLKQNIKLNVDVGHYHLANIMKAPKESSIVNRHAQLALTGMDLFGMNGNETDSTLDFYTMIGHVHVSDFDEKAHWGDLPFDTIHRAEYFTAILNNLAKKLPSDNGQNSMVVSLELEAARAIGTVEKSYRDLCRSCQAWNEGGPASGP